MLLLVAPGVLSEMTSGPSDGESLETATPTAGGDECGELDGDDCGDSTSSAAPPLLLLLALPSFMLALDEREVRSTP